MSTLRRAVIIVVDSCGVGASPDAADYGDEDTDTVGHTARAVGGLALPFFEAAGLGNLLGSIEGVPAVDSPSMAYGKAREASAGKDSTTGHWEIAGVITEEPHATFPDGFPADLVARLETETGHQFLGNYPASGTVIIEELGAEHLQTGKPILYTSADSVLQIASHTDIVPLDELYRICRSARIVADGYRIGRIIARPFEGRLGAFRRTYDRHDYAMAPPAPTLLDAAKGAGLDVIGVGKIEDLFVGNGLTDAVHTRGDLDGLKATRNAVKELDRGIVMTNLVDLDMRYGHREDPDGYAVGLTLIDEHLPHIIDVLTADDMMIITADHGTDPTDGDTNHSREYVPLLAQARNAAGVDLGIRDQFCDVAATVAEGLDLPAHFPGVSFWGEVS